MAIAKKFFPFPPRFLVVLAAVVSFSLFGCSAVEHVEMSFKIGSSVTLTCPQKNPERNDDFLMKWSLASQTIFEDDQLMLGTPDGYRYKMKMTDSDYDLTVSDLAADHDGAKFSCLFDAGDGSTTIKSYRLKTETAVKPTEALPDVVVTDAAPDLITTNADPVVTTKNRDNSKDGDDSKEEEKRRTEEEKKEEKDLHGGGGGGGGGGGNGTPSLTASSALAAVFITIYALTL